MGDADLEWDAMTPQPPRPAGLSENYDTITTSSESSESISERESLLGIDNKQAGTYGATEITGGEQDVVAESDGTTEVQNTPRAIAAVISVLLVGKDALSNGQHHMLIILSQVSLFPTPMEVLSSPHMERYPLSLELSKMQAG
jgi:hypothetical protein